MASVSRRMEKAQAERRGESIAEWLSKPNLPVKRGELWWWLNHYEANRLKASPWARLSRRAYRGLATFFARFRRKPILLEDTAELPKPEDITGGNHTENPSIDTGAVRKVYDANGRLVDADL